MKIEKVEKILKSRANEVNEKRHAWMVQGMPEQHCKPIEWQDALGFHYQSRNKIFKDCNGNCTLDPVTLQAYSYEHWRFVDSIKDKVVFNTYRYSQTTTNHQWAVRTLLKSLGIKIDLEVEVPKGLGRFNEDGLVNLYQKLAENEIILTRKGVRGSTKENAITCMQEVKSHIKIVRELGAKITEKTIQNIRDTAKANEARRLAKSAADRVNRSNENHQVKLLEQTGKVISLSEFAA